MAVAIQYDPARLIELGAELQAAIDVVDEVGSLDGPLADEIRRAYFVDDVGPSLLARVTEASRGWVDRALDWDPDAQQRRPRPPRKAGGTRQKLPPGYDDSLLRALGHRLADAQTVVHNLRDIDGPLVAELRVAATHMKKLRITRLVPGIDYNWICAVTQVSA